MFDRHKSNWNTSQRRTRQLQNVGFDAEPLSWERAPDASTDSADPKPSAAEEPTETPEG